MKGKKIAVLLTIVLSGLSVIALASDRSWPESVDQYIGKAKNGVTVIDMNAFKKVVDNKGSAVILDVREPNEFKTGHVPGAINIPRGLAEFKIWKAVAGYPAKTDTGKKIYCYCALGGRGLLTAKALQEIGFKNVIAVKMKVADWIKAGYPIER